MNKKARIPWWGWLLIAIGAIIVIVIILQLIVLGFFMAGL